MKTAQRVRPLPSSTTPADVLRRWRRDQPVVLLHSAGRRTQWGQWSVIARPRGWCRWVGEGVEIIGSIPCAEQLIGAPNALAMIDVAVLTASRECASARDRSSLPFTGGWIGWLSYELGAIIEPAASHTSPLPSPSRADPLIELAWCPDALVIDHVEQYWHRVGNVSIDDVLSDASLDESFNTGALAALRSPEAHCDAIRQTLEYIAAGDIFQANITQQLAAPFSGSSRAFARSAFSASAARYGAYMELPNGRRIVSMSPELFLQVDRIAQGDRVVTTRPIKGTRPPGTGQLEALRDSEKDIAELNMIIDLMRNDLGRVCNLGSVRVPHGRIIESHPTVYHGVGEVTGALREDVTLGDLLRATFPAGSITGAPKIRAMQIIEELEAEPRGTYCGAIGWISGNESLRLSVAIRTALLRGETLPDRFDLLQNGKLTYGVGGGIVSDSNPNDEYRESMDKAEVLRLAMQSGCAAMATE